jgi:hypothetical protein
MYWLIGTPRTIEDLQVAAALHAKTRGNASIAIIDDQAFPYLQLLKDHHYNVQKFNDINDVRMVQAYPIILCDIRGVGRALSEKFEGAHLISEIRKHYPHKVIIAYTAQQFDPTYNTYLADADFTEKKDADLERWIFTLDKAIEIASNPVNAWRRIRGQLLKSSLPITTVMKLEDQYVAFVTRKRTSFPDSKFSSHLPDNIKPLLESAFEIVKLYHGVG